MKRSTFAEIQRCIASFFADSNLNVGAVGRGEGGGVRRGERMGGRVGGGGGEGRCSGVYDGGGYRVKSSDVNLYFLPEMEAGSDR